MVLPFPFVKRLAIVYQNLGNLSSHYYKVAGYSLVAPVAGFAAYDATNLTTLGDEKLKFNVMGGDIVVNFGNIGELKFGNEEEMKCVKFGDGGLVQFRNLMEGYRCLAQGDGHFSIAVPSKEDKEKKRKALWAIRFATGFVGLVLVIVILVTTYKLVRSKRVRQMEGESDNGVTIDVHWIGSSKMPSASMVRTQPVLEHDDVP
ncbi:hypothetical protein JCGZ_14303 [Jatropha curcas]|uniref:Uncharacterized protein n=2 Tax=Jatropha curcas TaxID=180498 RepID=A0A067JXB9_JATCU|nr:hypothetical protein JCGZ_14303 [Jatropha curcas]